MTQPEASKPESAAVELLPCPFCGGRAISHRNPGLARWAVSCTQCDCKPLNHCARTEAEAIAAWNKRVPATALTALTERVERMEGENRALKDWLSMAIAEMSRARGRLDVIGTCNEDKRLANALGRTCDCARAALKETAS